jgi:hypothetical protein
MADGNRDKVDSSGGIGNDNDGVTWASMELEDKSSEQANWGGKTSVGQLDGDISARSQRHMGLEERRTEGKRSNEGKPRGRLEPWLATTSRNNALNGARSEMKVTATPVTGTRTTTASITKMTASKSKTSNGRSSKPKAAWQREQGRDQQQ